MAHIPVLLEETLNILEPKEGEFAIDGTIDGGGHAEKILERIGPTGKLLGVDLDEQMIRDSREKFAGKKNVILLGGNYKDLPEMLREKNLGLADMLLLDLGFSSEQLYSGKGFSFEKDEPLLMNYAPDATPAHVWLKKLKEQELADIIYRFGGERMFRRIAKAIKSAKGIDTTKKLAEVVKNALPKGYERGRIHPATRTFQALRIFVNRELENIETILNELTEIVRPGGRVAIITFHSLEDKLVKDGFKKLAKDGLAELLTKKPIPATFREIKANPRSRSAKIRGIKIS